MVKATSRHSTFSAVLALLVLALPGYVLAVGVTPISSAISYEVSADELSVENDKMQQDTLGTLSDGNNLADLGFSLGIQVAASWSDADTGSVSFSDFRNDSSEDGYRERFGTRADFRYEFSLDTASVITIDYLVDATSTLTNANSTLVWWGLGGFANIDVDGGLNRNFLPTGGSGLFSPIHYEGSYVIALDAGIHSLYIQLAGSASGNVPAQRREVSGSFEFQIGETAPVPVPAALWLMLAAMPLLNRRIRAHS